MKVVCITDSWYCFGGESSGPSKGQECFVVGNYGSFYIIDGYGDNKYHKSGFREPNFTNEITKALANGHEEIEEYNPKELEREKV